MSSDPSPQNVSLWNADAASHSHRKRYGPLIMKLIIILTANSGRLFSLVETLTNEDGDSNVGRQEKLYLPNPRVLLSISLLWLPCMFLFSLKFC